MSCQETSHRAHGLYNRWCWSISINLFLNTERVPSCCHPAKNSWSKTFLETFDFVEGRGSRGNCWWICSFLLNFLKKGIFFSTKKYLKNPLHFQLSGQKPHLHIFERSWHFYCHLSLFLTCDEKLWLGWWLLAEDPVKRKSSKKITSLKCGKKKKIKWQQYVQQLPAITFLSVSLSLVARPCFINLITAL